MPDKSCFLSDEHHKLYRQYYKVSRKYAQLIKEAKSTRTVKRLADPKSFEAWRLKESQLQGKTSEKVKTFVKSHIQNKRVRKGGNGDEVSNDQLRELLAISENPHFELYESSFPDMSKTNTRKKLKQAFVKNLGSNPQPTLLLKCLPTILKTEEFVAIFELLPPEKEIEDCERKLMNAEVLSTLEAQHLLRYKSLTALTQQDVDRAIRCFNTFVHVYHFLINSPNASKHPKLIEKYVTFVKRMLSHKPDDSWDHDAKHALRNMAKNCIIFQQPDLVTFTSEIKTLINNNRYIHTDWSKLYNIVNKIQEPKTYICHLSHASEMEVFYAPKVPMANWPKYLQLYIEKFGDTIPDFTLYHYHGDYINGTDLTDRFLEEAIEFIPRFNQLVANMQKTNSYIYVTDTILQFYIDLAKDMENLMGERVIDVSKSYRIATFKIPSEYESKLETFIEQLQQDLTNNFNNFWAVYVSWWESKGKFHDTYIRYITDINKISIRDGFDNE